MSKDTQELIEVTDVQQSRTRADEAQACITRFKVMHEAVKGSVMAAKLAKFFAGIEVQTLCDLHEEEHGETRGRPSGEKIVDTPLSTISLGDFLEEHLGVTDRTARRYRQHFLSCSEDKPELAEKLRKWWVKWKDEAPLQLAQAETPAKGKGKQETQLTQTAPSALALHEVCNLAAKDMKDLLEHADEWGLNELFEVPLKDVTPEEETPEAKASAAAAKERLAKFWLHDFARRALNNEFLKLRKQDKEALLTTLEEATNKLRDALKGGKKA